MTYELIARAAAAMQLELLGGFHPGDSDADLAGFETLILLGPREPGFWSAFSQSREFLDGAPNPMDRWSVRVLTGLAVAFNAQPFYPFGGPAYRPFFQWALRTGRCHPSPVSLLVHDQAGLFVSFRGALALTQRLDLPPTDPNPCSTCAGQPCRSACPVVAFETGQYDVAACRAYLKGVPDNDCMTMGCGARRSCPLSKTYGRQAAQSAFHMKAFQTNGS
ncbi:ferredoxin [Shimia sp.]|uniref:ferredoxin n=1 Tax=Shimia sp. TaxID=1954381 RepID=UPI0032996060